MALLLPIPGPSNSRWSEEATAISPGFRVWSRPGSTLWGVFLSLHPYKNAKIRGRRRGQVCCWVPNAVYTPSHTQSSEQGGGGGSTQTQWKPKSGAEGKRRDAVEAVGDAISFVNERIRREQSKRETRTVMDSEEADKYIELVKQQQQRGLEKLRGDASYKVDPYTLRSGDYVVHKKVGIGRFVGIKFDVSNSTAEYVFIEYADGMAKLPVKQASRLLYRYSLYVSLFSSFSFFLLIQQRTNKLEYVKQ